METFTITVLQPEKPKNLDEMIIDNTFVKGFQGNSATSEGLFQILPEALEEASRLAEKLMGQEEQAAMDEEIPVIGLA